MNGVKYTVPALQTQTG